MMHPDFADFIYIGLGIFFGAMIMSNKNEDVKRKLLKELDEQTQKDLEYYKNLSASLKQDLADLKNKK
jgi:hypothetical protein